MVHEQTVPFFTDPALYQPPEDGGPFIITQSVASVEHPGRQIPDVVVAQMVRVQRVTLTSWQLLNLDDEPIELLPTPEFTPSGQQGTPGPGLMYDLKTITYRSHPGEHTYNVSGDPQVFLGRPDEGGIKLMMDPQMAQYNARQMLNRHERMVFRYATVNYGIYDEVRKFENQPVYFGFDQNGGQITQGDGMFSILLEYTVTQL